MMAARTGRVDAIARTARSGGQGQREGELGRYDALDVGGLRGPCRCCQALIARGADVNARSNYVAAANGRGFEGARRWPTGRRESRGVRQRLADAADAAPRGGQRRARGNPGDASADVNARSGDGKTALALAIFNGNYDVASLLIDRKADVNIADAQRFTPLFWAVDRRNMETAPNFPWMVTADPLPLIRKLLDAGANPNALVNNTPRARMREGSPRIVFATALMRRRSPPISSSSSSCSSGARSEGRLQRRRDDGVGGSGLAFIHGYHRGKSNEERLQVVKLFVELGNDVNQADDYGITPLMAAPTMATSP
jgi:hypothetical protein